MAVQLGQRFEKVGAFLMVFEVVSLVKTRDGMPHARLRLVGDPSDIRMISESSLGDRHLYRQCPDTPVQG
ncbi:Serine/threonine protein kinase [uncultured Gammaproteobacteria bacterium]